MAENQGPMDGVTAHLTIRAVLNDDVMSGKLTIRGAGCEPVDSDISGRLAR